MCSRPSRLIVASRSRHRHAMISSAQVKLLSVARTDVGRRRQINEDALFRDDARGFYVVADGVGGHNKGEIASREAVEQLRMWVYGANRDLDRLVDRVREGDDECVWDIRRLLESGVELGHAVHQVA